MPEFRRSKIGGRKHEKRDILRWLFVPLSGSMLLKLVKAGYHLSSIRYCTWMTLSFMEKWIWTWPTCSDCENIQSRYWNGVWDIKMCTFSHEKREFLSEWRNRSVELSRNKSSLRMGNLQVSEGIGRRWNKAWSNKGEHLDWILQKSTKFPEKIQMIRRKCYKEC